MTDILIAVKHNRENTGYRNKYFYCVTLRWVGNTIATTCL